MKGDFIGFSFNGIHSDDMGIVRVSDGSRYSENLTPEVEDRTNTVPGHDGVYFYGSDFKDGKITVHIAFDELTDTQFRLLHRWLAMKQLAPLIFDEFPYKKYMAKVSAPPTLDYICFDERRRRAGDERNGVRVSERTWAAVAPLTDDTNEEPIESTESEEPAGESTEEPVVEPMYEKQITREKVYPWVYNEQPERIYKGEGTIDFEIPFPYGIATGKTIEEVEANVPSASLSDQWTEGSMVPALSTYNLNNLNKILYDGEGTNDGKILRVHIYNCGDIETGFKLTVDKSTTALTIANSINDISTKVMQLDFTIMPIEDDSAVVIDTYNRIVRGVDTGTLYNKCIVTGDFFLLQPSVSMQSDGLKIITDQDLTLASQSTYPTEVTNMSIDYTYLFY